VMPRRRLQGGAGRRPAMSKDEFRRVSKGVSAHVAKVFGKVSARSSEGFGACSETNGPRFQRRFLQGPREGFLKRSRRLRAVLPFRLPFLLPLQLQAPASASSFRLLSSFEVRFLHQFQGSRQASASNGPPGVFLRPSRNFRKKSGTDFRGTDLKICLVLTKRQRELEYEQESMVLGGFEGFSQNFVGFSSNFGAMGVLSRFLEGFRVYSRERFWRVFIEFRCFSLQFWSYGCSALQGSGWS